MSPREAGGRRRRGARAYGALVLAWTASFMTALVLLPPGAHTTAVAHADSSAVTKIGPPVWDPVGQQSGPRGTVTVDQTKNLADQVVHVSWTGFTPSVGQPYVVPGGSGWQSVLYPVVVYQCRGEDPQITDCYGAVHYGQDPAKEFDQPLENIGLWAPDYPNNEQAGVTHADGSGSVDIEVYTSFQSPTLGCDATHKCSIVVEPVYGGDALGYNTADGSPNCADHSADVGTGGEATGSVILGADIDNNASGERCAWKANHTVIPISFAPVPTSCPQNATSVSGEGMPMLDRALTQWVVGACLASSSPLTVQTASGLTEPQARQDFLQGRRGTDVAFTSLPADPADSSARPYTYVPIGSGGIAITFLVDDPNTGLPIKNMKLNARLVAKLLTQSYDTSSFAGAKSDTASVAGNPICLFNDKEFLQLNPNDGFSWPVCPALDAPGTLPIVTGGQTDLVRELTTWIKSDPDASAFLDGKPDPWGMHVDSFYKSADYPFPIDSFVSQDASGPPNQPCCGVPWPTTGDSRDGGKAKSFEWTPLQSGLDDVLRHELTFSASCFGVDYDNDGKHPKCAPQAVGARGVLAIMDTGRAAAFSLPTAALRNEAGSYVTANAPGLSAATADYVTDAKTGTQSLPWGKADTSYASDAYAYPLTVPNYAMAPTSGLPAAKATNVAAFLAEVTDPATGQAAGNSPGRLAPGYVPNTVPQARQAQEAITKIAPAPPSSPGPSGGGTVTVTGRVTTSGTAVLTPITVSADGTTSVRYVTATTKGGSGTGGGSGGDTGGTGDTGGATDATGGSTTSRGTPAGGPAGSSGPTHSLTGSTTPAAAVAGSTNADTAGLSRYVLPVLLVIGVVLVAAGPAGLALSSASGLDRLRAARALAKRRFGK